MRSEAYKISGFTLVISALGFMLRWLQDMRIMDEETGLAVNAPISWAVLLVMALTAAALAFLVFRLRQFDALTAPAEALAGSTPFYRAVAMLPAVLLALAGVFEAVHPGNVLWPTLHRLCGAAMVIGAFGAGVVTANETRSDGGDNCRRGSVMLIFFACFWLITGYRDAATDPVVWRFAVRIVAQCVVLLAYHYRAGYFFEVPHPWMTLFTCNLGAFLCVMSAIDEVGIAQSLAYAAVAAQLMIWGFVLVENLKTKPLFPETAQKEG